MPSSQQTRAAHRRAPAASQRWARYRPEDHAVWATLYRHRMAELERQASRVYLDGLAKVGIEADAIPNLRAINRRLAPLTGWRAVPVAGYLDPVDFFASLAARRFPTTVTIRAADSLDYTPAPDIFHDVFGHVPLHADPDFARWLERFAAISLTRREPRVVERLARLFWFTVEFGLIREQGEIRVYGSGLISSIAEARHALGSACDRRPFELEEVLDRPFAIDELQPVLYVVDGFGALVDALARVESVL